MLKNIESDFISEEYDSSHLENGTNDIISYENLKITLTTTKNQRNNIDNPNETAIDLGQCELILRENYNISDNELLYMIKMEFIQEGMKIPKINYVAYSKLNKNHLFKLNLSYCYKSKIDISIPVVLTESKDIHNSSSGYYSDICYPAKSEYGTDITSKDRKKEFIEKNRTVCQENCIFADYNDKIKKAKCICDFEEFQFSLSNMNFNMTKLYNNFMNVKNYININILKCYKKLFTKKGIVYNYGSYSLMLIILMHFIFIIIFFVKHSYNKIQEKIKEIEFAIRNWNSISEEEQKDKKETKNSKINKTQKKGRKKKSKKKNNPPIKKSGEIKINLNDNKNTNKNKGLKTNNIITQNTNGRSIKKLNTTENKNKIVEKIKTIMAYNDEELNSLKYELALKYDHRTYIEYYISLLRTKHILLFTFFNNNDYNSKVIKIDLLLFSFSLYFAINTLFFNDNTIHQIYKDKGLFNFIYQIPQIIFSSLISFVIQLFIKLLALSQGLILRFKKKKYIKYLDKRVIILNKQIKIKFILYFIFSTIFLLFFWYYISMFCIIYVNTQSHLIKDTLISFAMSFISPLVIHLIPGIFRIPSLSNKKNKRNYLYGISKIIQMI